MNWLEKFLMEEPPYKEIEIDHFILKKICYESHFLIEHYCGKCNKLRTFKSSYNQFNSIACEYQERSRVYTGIEWEEFSKNYSDCFSLDFQCQHNCSEHHYFAILIHNLTIQKVGQYPTFAKEEINEKILKYKSLIPKYYPELTKAISAYSQNMGVPSFVYLRRILEHLVDEKATLYGVKTDQKFVDKLKEVEGHEKIIPAEFDEIKNQLYTVLSKGVHEYEEEECLDIFSAVKFIIESILDKELIKKEHDQKAKEAKEIIRKKLKKS